MSQTLVVKIGTNVILGNKSQVNIKILENIADQIVNIKKAGYKIIIVSSGAVACGRELAHDQRKEHSVSFLAAIGQTNLINYYVNLFSKHQKIIAQILLTGDDFLNRQRYNFIYETLTELLAHEIIPIINENDVVTRDYWGFGENDFLAAMTAINVGADKIVFLTNVRGLYSKHPEEEGSKLIKEIKNTEDIAEKIESIGVKSALGKGGMSSKISSAYLAASAGVEAYIINGLEEKTLEELVLKNKNHGTRIKAAHRKLNQKKGWLFIGRLRPGKIIIDNGASQAVRAGKSLLAIGIKGIKGGFHAKDVVAVLDSENKIIGYGAVNFSAKELTGINKLETDKIKEKFKKEVIHRDNLTVLK